MLHLKGYFPSKPVQIISRCFTVHCQPLAIVRPLGAAERSAPQTASDPASNPAKNTVSSAVKKK